MTDIKDIYAVYNAILKLHKAYMDDLQCDRIFSLVEQINALNSQYNDPFCNDMTEAFYRWYKMHFSVGRTVGGDWTKKEEVKTEFNFKEFYTDLWKFHRVLYTDMDKIDFSNDKSAQIFWQSTNEVARTLSSKYDFPACKIYIHAVLNMLEREAELRKTQQK